MISDKEKYNLLIVESPTKAATISKYLKEEDDEWIVLHTKGHIFDLPKKSYGLRFEDDEVVGDWEFVSKDTEKILREINKFAANADTVFIATDDDREGERIASDLANYLGIDNYERVAFGEITRKSVIQELYMSTREIDPKIVEAAKANRFIDRELGWKISTIMMQDLKMTDPASKSEGTGRVLSPSLALVCSREREIIDFVPQRYNKVVIDYVYSGRSFSATNSLKFLLEDEVYLNAYINKLQSGKHLVSSYEEKIDEVAPHKPLHTSSLQYSAWYVLQIMPDKAMQLAQRLFELGLITYHRTDSVRMSESAVKALRNYIGFNFPAEYLSPSVRKFKPKKNTEEDIQDAHEAIRPTQFTDAFSPASIAQSNSVKLSEDEMALYTLIWARTLITQMSDAKYDVSVITVDIDGERFSATANELLFDGWEIVSREILNISKIRGTSWRGEPVTLPSVKIDEELYPLEIRSKEHKTQRAKRYGVGTFIAAVHTMGFARPSTIGTLLKRLEQKRYIEINKGILYPTALGMKVDEWTSLHFGWLNDLKHAKVFETELQRIANGEIAFGDSLVIEYKEKIDEVAERLGIDLSRMVSNAPSPSQVKLIESIAQKHGIVIGKEILEDKKKAATFISKYRKITKIKKCPYCNAGDINEQESLFKCSNPDCDFFITKKRILKYFEQRGKVVEEYELPDMVKSLTLKKGYKVENLVSKKGTTYSPVLVFDRSKEYGWGIEFLSNVKKKGEQNG